MGFFQPPASKRRVVSKMAKERKRAIIRGIYNKVIQSVEGENASPDNQAMLWPSPLAGTQSLAKSQTFANSVPQLKKATLKDLIYEGVI